jgi:hypothetical protein
VGIYPLAAVLLFRLSTRSARRPLPRIILGMPVFVETSVDQGKMSV